MPLRGRKSFDKAVDKAVGNLNKKLTAVYVQGLTAIVRMTPVHFKDGGRLRNNWFLTVGQPSTKTRAGATAGTASLGELGKLPVNVLGKKVYFTNNLPYANTVEYGGYPNPPEKGTWTGGGYQKLSAGGYSRQAPNGMVRINLTKMKARIKKL